MKSAQRKAPASENSQRRESVFTPRTLDPEARTVEVVAATETAVAMPSFFGAVREILKCDAASVQTARLDGLPVLDSHDRSSVLSILGRATKWRLEDGKLLVTFKFADSDRGLEAFDLVKDGMINKVSIGYRIDQFEETEVRRGEVLRTVTKWTPYEISLVSVPADHNATIRGASVMDPETLEEPEGGTRQVAIHPDARQNQRSAEIMSIGSQAKMPALEIEDAIRSGTPLADFRTRAFNFLAAASSAIITTPNRSGDYSERSTLISDQVIDAIAVRLGSPAAAGVENPLRGRSMTEIGREFFAASGVDVRSMDDLSISDAMLGRQRSWVGGSRSLHTTSDFPALMADGANRALLARYSIDPSPLKGLSQRRDAKDYRANTMIRPGEAPKLEKVLENGEVESGTLGEAVETFKVETYGKMFGLSRQALVNDDLGAFADFVQAMGESSAQTEADLFFGLLSANTFGGAKTSDGVNFFHADHKNRAATGTAITVDDLSKGREAMRRQNNVNGTGTAGVTPRVLLVGPAKETEAQRVVAQINATTVSDVNPFSGKLTVEVENRYSGLGWWLFGDRPAFVHGYLNGTNGPQIETQDGWKILGVEFRCILDFGCGPLDYRSAYFNPGA